MRRVALYVIGVVAVSLAVGTVAAANPPDAPACGDTADGAVVAVQNGDTHTDSLTVYPETKLYVAYCENGSPVQPQVGGTSNWDIRDTAGFQNVTVDGDWYSVDVPNDQSKVALNDETLDGKAPQREFVVSVQGGTRYDSTLTAEPLPFRPDPYNRFQTAESRYRNARTDVRENLSELNRTAQNIREGSAEAFQTEYESAATRILADLNASATAMRTQATTMEDVLYMAAINQTLPAEQYVSALEELDRQQGRTDDKLMNALNNYRNALQSVESTARQSILFKTLAGLLAGALIGGVGSGYRIHQRGQKIQDFSDFRGKDFDTSLLTWPLGAGVVLLLVGLVLFAVTGLWVVVL
jgi:vacuolar-type H+-ATPase subunit H